MFLPISSDRQGYNLQFFMFCHSQIPQNVFLMQYVCSQKTHTLKEASPKPLTPASGSAAIPLAPLQE
jgi:hypothetical protein